MTFVETNKSKNKGKTVGVSRDVNIYLFIRQKMEMSGIAGSLNKYSPGPGMYKLNSTLST